MTMENVIEYVATLMDERAGLVERLAEIDREIAGSWKPGTKPAASTTRATLDDTMQAPIVRDNMVAWSGAAPPPVEAMTESGTVPASALIAAAEERDKARAELDALRRSFDSRVSAIEAQREHFAQAAEEKARAYAEVAKKLDQAIEVPSMLPNLVPNTRELDNRLWWVGDDGAFANIVVEADALHAWAMRLVAERNAARGELMVLRRQLEQARGVKWAERPAVSEGVTNGKSLAERTKGITNG